jgi:hypothetical protein
MHLKKYYYLIYMPVYINGTSPKMKKEKLKCKECKQEKICIRIENKHNQDICRPCWNKSNSGPIWCVYCEICGHLALEDNEKGCEKCGKTVGMCCGVLYHCQSSECVCKNCFDYKCEKCGDPLDRDRQFVSDDDESMMPLCHNCIVK